MKWCQKMNKTVKTEILNQIKKYNKIVIVRHIRPDGDCMGASLGLKALLKNTYPEKTILTISEDSSEYLSFLGKDDEVPADFDYSDALIIAVDTATTERISNKNFDRGACLIKMDHHIDIKPYGDISWVEDYRSSACEMMVDFYLTFKDELKMSDYAATCFYTGMVTDSGRFKYKEVTGDTMRLAGAMLDFNIDTQIIYANLGLEDFSYYKFQAYIFGKIKMTENGVAYLYVTQAMKDKLGLSNEQASSSVSFMEGIKGCLIWIAFIDNGDGSIRVRLRSRFAKVSDLAERYNGGGHEMASGATCYSKKQMKALITDADELLKEYKQTHTGWM